MASVLAVRNREQREASARTTQRAFIAKWRWFALASGLSALTLLAFASWMQFRFGGARLTAAVDDVGSAIVALLVAIVCASSARRSTGRRALSGWLLTATAVVWAIGELITSFYQVGLGVRLPFPSVADGFFPLAGLLATAAVVAVPLRVSRLSTRGRTWLDGGTIALSLLFVSLALGLGKQFHPYLHGWMIGQNVGLAYPLGDILVLTLVVLAIRRNAHTSRGKTLLWLAGLAVIALTDSVGSLVSQVRFSSPIDSGFVAGFMLIGLSRLWPMFTADSSDRDAPVTLWQMAVPWMALVLVLATSVLATVSGQGLNNTVIAPSAGLVILLMVSQLLTYRESLALLSGSKGAEAQLRERTVLLNQIFTNAPLGIARVRRDLTIIDVNPAFSVLMRNPIDAIIGTSITGNIPSEDLVFMASKMKELEAGKVEAVESETLTTRIDGSQLWLHWMATAVRDARGVVDYYLGTFEDFTAKHEAEQLALASLAGLERLNRLKSEFVSMVSHEFRTGLVGIQGFSEVMKDEDLDPAEVKTFAGDINNDAQRLNRMISEMLDLDRMESGRMTLQLSPQDMNAKINETVERASVTTDKHSIVTDLDPKLPTVRADSDRLIQVLTNLLSNAVKYSPAGGEIKVSSRLENGLVHVRIRDHGLGIPPEYIDKLFGRYERFEQSHPTKIIGTGLGLAICRQIIEMHGGKIWAESTHGAGSVFHFTLPTTVQAANASWTIMPAVPAAAPVLAG